MSTTCGPHSYDTAQLHREFDTRLRAFAARRVAASDEVDDAVQDVYVRLHQSLPSLGCDECAPAWVFGIARRTLADRWRRHYATPATAPLADAAALADDQPAPEHLASYRGDHDVHQEVLSWLRPLAEALDPHDREALILADFEGITQREVAQRLGLSLSGAKSRVQRARTRLAEALAACCDVEFGTAGTAVAFTPLAPAGPAEACCDARS